MCVILVANIIWRSGQAIRSSFLLVFSLSTIVADVSSQFSVTAMLHNRFGGAFDGIIFGRQIVLSMHKNGQGELASC